MIRRFLLQFHNVLIYVLLAAAVGAALLRHPTDAAVIVAVVVINAVAGFIQEGRAERALAGISHMIDPSALYEGALAVYGPAWRASNISPAIATRSA